MKKKKPRITAADIIKLSQQIEALYVRCAQHLQGAEISADLVAMQPHLVNMVGKLTLLEARRKP